MQCYINIGERGLPWTQEKRKCLPSRRGFLKISLLSPTLTVLPKRLLNWDSIGRAGKTVRESNLNEMDRLWNEAKRRGKTKRKAEVKVKVKGKAKGQVQA